MDWFDTAVDMSREEMLLTARMTFGKHVGELVRELPTPYLQWLCLLFRPYPGSDETIRDAAREELIKRSKSDYRITVPPPFERVGKVVKL